jgi:uncharacterized damage-inducible protein DinB
MTPPFGPAEAKFILEAVGFPALRFEHAVTARIIAAVPPAQTDFRPCAGARSAEELARHIVGAELRFLEGALTGVFPDRIPETTSAPDLASLATTYATSVGVVLERLANIRGEELLRVIDYRGLIRLPALGFVQLAINHSIHHRGQLSVYLRSMGVAVPPIYG